MILASHTETVEVCRSCGRSHVDVEVRQMDQPVYDRGVKFDRFYRCTGWPRCLVMLPAVVSPERQPQPLRPRRSTLERKGER